VLTLPLMPAKHNLSKSETQSIMIGGVSGVTETNSCIQLSFGCPSAAIITPAY